MHRKCCAFAVIIKIFEIFAEPAQVPTSIEVSDYRLQYRYQKRCRTN